MPVSFRADRGLPTFRGALRPLAMIVRLALLRSWVAMLALALWTHTARAQEVHGRVSLSEATRPASGLLVTLVDSVGAVRARGLTSAQGEFRLRAPRAGRYRVRVLRIGYRPTTSEVLVLRDGESRELKLELTGAAISLRGVAVTADRQCATESAASAALDAWDEARKALDAALLSRGEPLEVSVVRRDRRLRASDGAILSERDEPRHGMSLRPYVSIPAATIAARGYVLPDGSGAVYAAPDEEILLAPDFAVTHCLRLISTSADSLALGFAPTRDRSVPEIAGVLLLDPSTHELRELVFHYVNTEQRAEGAGGRVHFRRLAGGRWMVDRWSLRLPLLAPVVTQHVGTMSDLRSGVRRTTTLEVAEFQETSGEVTDVARGGEILWASTASSYAGVLVDERGGAVTAAIVRLPMLERETGTDSSGRFRFDGVGPGVHQLIVQTAWLDSLGLPPLAPLRTAPVGDAQIVRLTMPSRDALIRRVCSLPSNEASDDAFGVMRGLTRSSNGAPFGGVTIIAEWFATRELGRTGEIGTRQSLRTVSDDRGQYVLCGMRTSQPVTIRLEYRGLPISYARIEIPSPSRILIQDFAPTH